LLPALALGWIEIMPYKLRIEQFVRGAEISLMPDFVPNAPGDTNVQFLSRW
jgi:hypothetical protein